MRRWRKLACGAALLLWPGTGHAALAEVQAAAGTLVDQYFHAVFSFNRVLYQQLDDLLPAPATAGETTAGMVATGLANVVGNLVNEPITMISSVLVGDTATAGHAATRFAINSTAGYLGLRDRAREWGYEPRYADLGLSLCRMGVGEGGYVVLPFIGPRTVRDGLADVVLTNAVMWSAVGVVAGSGAGLRTLLIAETLEVGADIVGTRQIDPVARRIRLDSYDVVREAYLAQRRARCAVAAGDP